MFKIIEVCMETDHTGICIDSSCYVQDDKARKQFLHSDGSVYRTVEYWPTRELAQTVLDKYYPKHVWKHGDVFNSDGEYPKVYIKISDQQPQVFHLQGAPNDEGMVAMGHFSKYLKDATFLFNINNILPC